MTWSKSAFGAPAIADAVAHLHCRPANRVEAGDHWIVLCSVDAMSVDRPIVAPLLFFQGGYGHFSAGPADAPSAEGLDYRSWFHSDFPL